MYWRKCWPTEIFPEIPKLPPSLGAFVGVIQYGKDPLDSGNILACVSILLQLFVVPYLVLKDLLHKIRSA